jgi:hypothetical protein
MKFAYADPPYIGCCALYDHYHPDGWLGYQPGDQIVDLYPGTGSMSHAQATLIFEDGKFPW